MSAIETGSSVIVGDSENITVVAPSTVVAGGAAETFYILQADGVSKITLGDGSGSMLRGEAP